MHICMSCLERQVTCLGCAGWGGCPHERAGGEASSLGRQGGGNGWVRWEPGGCCENARSKAGSIRWDKRTIKALVSITRVGEFLTKITCDSGCSPAARETRRVKAGISCLSCRSAAVTSHDLALYLCRIRSCALLWALGRVEWREAGEWRRERLNVDEWSRCVGRGRRRCLKQMPQSWWRCWRTPTLSSSARRTQRGRTPLRERRGC